MKREQLDVIINNFDDFEDINIKYLMAIENENIIDIILKCEPNRKNIIIDLYKKRNDNLRVKLNVNVYEKIAFAKSDGFSKFMARIYAVNETLINKAEQCKNAKTRELLLKFLENEALYEIVGENNITYMGSKIIEEENEDKQEVLVEFLCDEDIQKSCDSDHILGLFNQLNIMQDIEKCKKLIEYIKTLKTANGTTIKTLIKMMPEEIIEETIDTDKKEDLEKLARLLDKTGVSSFSSKNKEINVNKAYIKTRFKSSKNDN